MKLLQSIKSRHDSPLKILNNVYRKGERELRYIKDGRNTRLYEYCW